LMQDVVISAESILFVMIDNISISQEIINVFNLLL